MAPDLPRRLAAAIALGLLLGLPLGAVSEEAATEEAAVEETAGPALRAGAAAVEIAADDSMLIGGGIHPGRARGQEGKLRAAAIVLEGPGAASGSSRERVKLAIVACDVLMIRRDYLDQATARIEKEIGIPAANVLINATHTHHAPSTATIHGYERVEEFCGSVRDAAVEAVRAAARRLADAPAAEMLFRRGIESSVGQNSRLLLADGTIYWVGPRDDAVRPTGPFDADLPVIAFRSRGAAAGKFEAVLFNHSTHCIGVRAPGVRSPGFYGLAAQELEEELGGTAVFVAGAFGSTHNLGLKCDEMVIRIKAAVRDALAAAEPRPPAPLRALRREVAYRVRRFDEEREEEAVASYCRKRVGEPEGVIEVFRRMRRELAPHQGEERRTWIQAMRLGDIVLVGIPGEFFTVLGIEIKRRSPFRYTCIAGVANDYIGYIPDDRAYDLGGYQVWTGFHSLVERGTGERFVREALEMLEELRRE